MVVQDLSEELDQVARSSAAFPPFGTFRPRFVFVSGRVPLTIRSASAAVRLLAANVGPRRVRATWDLDRCELWLGGGHWTALAHQVDGEHHQGDPHQAEAGHPGEAERLVPQYRADDELDGGGEVLQDAERGQRHPGGGRAKGQQRDGGHQAGGG